MAKQKQPTAYKVLRNEPRMGIGGWTRDLRQGDILTDLPDYVVDALTAEPNPLIEETDPSAGSDPEQVQAILDQAADDIAAISPVEEDVEVTANEKPKGG